MVSSNKVTIEGTVNTVGVLSATLDVGIYKLNGYDMAVNNGYQGTLQQWVLDSLASVITDVGIDSDGELTMSYDETKYDFYTLADGSLVVEVKE